MLEFQDVPSMSDGPLKVHVLVIDTVDAESGRKLELKTCVKLIDRGPGYLIPPATLVSEIKKHARDCQHVDADLVIGFILGREARSFVQFKIPRELLSMEQRLSDRTMEILDNLLEKMPGRALKKVKVTGSGRVELSDWPETDDEWVKEARDKFTYALGLY
eukprot:TRINITY_DN10719_c0_g1_i1.p1 TRINITY_DN10719_c0_g1~~TRINITY_DN10719_c0_g1_i1.p1  ORF type:complete len:161 (+),score=2.98 TRINITY_DN10719_c0_g1_i1:161-643(+)